MRPVIEQAVPPCHKTQRAETGGGAHRRECLGPHEGTVALDRLPAPHVRHSRGRRSVESPSRVPAYVIVDATVHDPDAFAAYLAASPTTVAAGSGRFLARGGEIAMLEGDWHPKRIVVLEFADTQGREALVRLRGLSSCDHTARSQTGHPSAAFTTSVGRTTSFPFHPRACLSILSGVAATTGETFSPSDSRNVSRVRGVAVDRCAGRCLEGSTR
jgi:uncharacterized protein (DUF1330 family)